MCVCVCVCTVVNIAVLLFVIIVGATQVSSANYTAVNGSFVPYGGASVLRAAGTVFFSYIGFDQVSLLAEEVKNPQRDLPIGIIGSLAVAGTTRRLGEACAVS